MDYEQDVNRFTKEPNINSLTKVNMFINCYYYLISN